MQKRFTRNVEREVSKVTVNRKRILEGLEASPEVRKDKIAVLKKSITEGTYQVGAEDIAGKLLKEWFLELDLTLNRHEYQGGRDS